MLIKVVLIIEKRVCRKDGKFSVVSETSSFPMSSMGKIFSILTKKNYILMMGIDFSSALKEFGKKFLNESVSPAQNVQGLCVFND